ncbi:MAG TPA: energy transducer TonB [Longimicrobium sp.]|nr:energy transducer TonB [Longimicrobium sp.]
MKLIPIALLLAAAAAPAALRAQTAAPEPAADPADTLRAVDMAAVDELPSLVDRAEVARVLDALYPQTLKASGVSGTVKVRFVVDGRGRALAPRVAEASAHAELDSAALRAVDAMRFVPARKGGEPQPVWVELPVTFESAPAPAARAAREAGPDSLGAYEMEEVEALPRLANRNDSAREIARVYPPLLRDRGVTGMVSLRFLVDTLGVPGEPTVEHSTQPEFAAAAVQVVEKMRFVPAQVGGKKVRVWVTIPISFQLRKAPDDNTPPSQRRPRPGQRTDPWGNPWP